MIPIKTICKKKRKISFHFIFYSNFFFGFWFQMRDRDRELWTIGAGTFLSRSEGCSHSVSIQRLDALLYTQGKFIIITFLSIYLLPLIYWSRNYLIQSQERNLDNEEL